MNAHSRRCVLISLSAMVICGQAALAQTQQSDYERLRQQGIERNGERITQLSRLHALPPPQSPGRLQADTSLGRLIIEDLPERNLLLEAYKKPK